MSDTIFVVLAVDGVDIGGALFGLALLVLAVIIAIPAGARRRAAP